MSSVTTWTLSMGGLIALAIGPSNGSAGEIQKILDNSKAFAAMPRMTHTPAFRLAENGSRAAGRRTDHVRSSQPSPRTRGLH